MITFPNKIAIGSAHSKLILIGEHSVVYGKPAIALPFPTLFVRSTVEKTDGLITIDSRFYTGVIDEAPKFLDGLIACMKETLRELKQPENGLNIHIQSTIPIGRGLGSSAASAVAVVKSLFKYFGQPLQKEKLMKLVEVAETYAHGTPSGIDMAATSSEQTIWFVKDEKIKTIEFTTPFYLVVADTGRVGNTREAVGAIRDTLKVAPKIITQSINRLEELAHQAKTALYDGDSQVLGNVMNAAQDELCILGVSDQGIDDLVEVARKAGALGAKLTGGGKGGCIIALAKNRQQAEVLSEALKANGANETWYFATDETLSY